MPCSLARPLLLLVLHLLAGPRSASAQNLLDLAFHYQRLEQAYARDDLPAAARAEIHRAADGVVRAFFAGRADAAVDRLDGATLLALVGGTDRAPSSTFASVAALRSTLDEDDRIVLRAAEPFVAPCRIELGWRPHGPTPPTTAWSVEITLDGAGPWTVTPPPDAPAGRGWIVARIAPHLELPIGVATRGARGLPAARDALAARLDALPASELAVARAIAASRVAALVPAGPFDVTAWTLDRVALARAASAEVARLEAGVDPYRDETLPAESGRDLWLRAPVGDPRTGGVPCRLVLPPTLDPAHPAPLIVALHGAGGNEHLFVDGHGAGALPRLAAAHGAIVLAPSTLALMRPEVLPALLDLVAARWPVDRARVVLLGHSLGAATVVALAARHPDLVHAACGIAGAGPATASVAVPLRLYGAAADPIVPCTSVRAAAASAQAAGRPCTYVEVADAGHLLVVADVLAEAIDWLLAPDAAPR